MSRRNSTEKRKLIPDFKYQSNDIAKFINTIMEEGKKSIAQNIVYTAIENSASKIQTTAIEFFNTVLDNVKPLSEVKSRRVGGATYQVPIDVRPDRSVALALRWIKAAAKKRFGLSMKEKLAAELLDAYNGKGAAVKKREDTHKMAESNKVFAHFAHDKKKKTN